METILTVAITILAGNSLAPCPHHLSIHSPGKKTYAFCPK